MICFCDLFAVSQMDNANYVPISVLSNFNQVRMKCGRMGGRDGRHPHCQQYIVLQLALISEHYCNHCTCNETANLW